MLQCTSNSKINYLDKCVKLHICGKWISNRNAFPNNGKKKMKEILKERKKKEKKVKNEWEKYLGSFYPLTWIGGELSMKILRGQIATRVKIHGDKNYNYKLRVTMSFYHTITFDLGTVGKIF